MFGIRIIQSLAEFSLALFGAGTNWVVTVYFSSIPSIKPSTKSPTFKRPSDPQCDFELARGEEVANEKKQVLQSVRVCVCVCARICACQGIESSWQAACETVFPQILAKQPAPVNNTSPRCNGVSSLALDFV